MPLHWTWFVVKLRILAIGWAREPLIYRWNNFLVRAYFEVFPVGLEPLLCRIWTNLFHDQSPPGWRDKAFWITYILIDFFSYLQVHAFFSISTDPFLHDWWWRWRYFYQNLILKKHLTDKLFFLVFLLALTKCSFHDY